MLSVEPEMKEREEGEKRDMIKIKGKDKAMCGRDKRMKEERFIRKRSTVKGGEDNKMKEGKG